MYPEAAAYVWGLGYHWYGDPRFESWPDRSEVPFGDRQREGAYMIIMYVSNQFVFEHQLYN